jgi:lipoprotein-anchoring transpeptidase ErfK/SrfK
MADYLSDLSSQSRRAERLLRKRPLALYAGVVGIAVVIVAVVSATLYGLWPRLRSQRTDSLPAFVSYVFLQQPVYYRSSHPEGTVVIDKAQNFLYVIRSNVMAVRYGIGSGPECADTAGLYRVLRKERWPGVQVASGAADNADTMLVRSAEGPPLGARIIHLEKDYRIHGTNVPNSIGRSVASGCFRLTNEDIIGIDRNLPVDARVVVQD